MEKKKLSIVNSSIKGYHVFKITPHPDIKMSVKKECNNGKRSICNGGGDPLIIFIFQLAIDMQ